MVYFTLDGSQIIPKHSGPNPHHNHMSLSRMAAELRWEKPTGVQDIATDIVFEVIFPLGHMRSHLPEFSNHYQTKIRYSSKNGNGQEKQPTIAICCTV